MRTKMLVAGAVAAFAIACSTSPAPEATADEPCPLAHANPKESPTNVPFHDKAKMKEFQGLDGKTHPRVTIEWPKEDEVLEKGEGVVKYKLEGYEIGKTEAGKFQHCHLILDNKPYEADYDHTTTLEKLNGGKPLEEGTHLLTIFPARNFHLSLKSEGACAQVRFHVKKKTGGVPGATDPQLVYSRPKGAYDTKLNEAKVILLDFYLLHAKLSPDGHRVHAVVTDEGGKQLEEHTITEWWPQLILKDAKVGKYKVTIELQDKDGKPVPGAFNKTTREITVK